MNSGIQLIRANLLTAVILLGTAQNALKLGTEDPEEQPDYLIGEAEEMIREALIELNVYSLAVGRRVRSTSRAGARPTRARKVTPRKKARAR